MRSRAASYGSAPRRTRPSATLGQKPALDEAGDDTVVDAAYREIYQAVEHGPR